MQFGHRIQCLAVRRYGEQPPAPVDTGTVDPDQLTDKEAQQFWPVYDRYTSELDKIEDRKFELLQEYARDYSTITDEQADAYIKGRAAVEESILQLRLKYMPVFRKVLSGRTAALFTQMDFRLGLVVDLQLASQVPMIEP